MKILNEVKKNLKIMFRNWTSLSLLIIAPIIMILIIGYSLSGEDLKDMKIGVISTETNIFSFIGNNIDLDGKIYKYDNEGLCIEDLSFQKLNLCIDIKGDLTAKGKNEEQVQIKYYYDNSRKKTSLPLIQYLQDFFGVKAEQISIESAETILKDLNTLVSFIYDKKELISDIRKESTQIKIQLRERKAKLEKAREDFNPSYEKIKDLQSKITIYNKQLNTSKNELDSQIKEISTSLNIIDEQVKDINENLNLTLNFSSNPLKNQLNNFKNTTNSTYLQIENMVTSVDTTVTKLDEIDALLENEIALNDEILIKIEESVTAIEKADTELGNKLEELREVNPDIASKLIRPIISEYSMILENKKNIQLSFPLLSVIIIMFISLLFSNISTLTEIYDKAHLRNIIAPVNNLIFTLGLWITSIIVILFQIIIFFFIAQTQLGIDILSVFWQISFIALLLIMIFTLIGMIYAYIFKTIQSSILMTTFTALAFFIFGNTLAPKETLPEIARLVSELNPLVIGEFLINQVQLFKHGLFLFTNQIILLLVYIIILGIILIIIIKHKK